MYLYPVDYAQKNIWCTPRQDTQSIIAPQKISQLGGNWINFFWQWNWMPLPVTDGTKFHVYTFNAIRPADLGLADTEDQWVCVADIMQDRHLIVDIYTQRGIQMPRYAVWYRVTRNRTLLFAVQMQPTIAVNMDSEQLYFRFYRNAYYNSQMSDPLNDYIETAGELVTTTAELVAFLNTYQGVVNDIASGARVKGAVYAFVNGYRVSDLSLFNVTVPATVEWVYDSSIYKVFDIPVAQLPSFTSTMDAMVKYLLRDSDPLVDQIAYLDDTDIWLYQAGSTAYWKGVYYHRNTVQAQRMLTHKDYSVPVDYVKNLGTANTELAWSDPTQTVIRLHLRYSGWNRNLVDEANRINALYRLEDDDITQAMVGTNSLVPNWTADTLESSAYPKIMGGDFTTITSQLVQDALGYNALSKLLADSPVTLSNPSDQLIAQLPYGLTDVCTGYEFDANGLYLGASQHKDTTTYVAVNPTASMVELIYGQGSNYINDIEGQQTVTLDPSTAFRVYTCPIDAVTGKPTYVWTDITNTSQYAFLNGTLTMFTDSTKFYPLIRTMDYHLYYEIDIPLYKGVLSFILTQNSLRGGNNITIEQEIEMERYDFWVNGYRLVPGIDYIVDFPNVTIITSAYFKNPQTDNQHVCIRGMGLKDASATYQPVDDTGFVMWGRLSNNQRWNLRDDKVQTFQVGGKTFQKSDLKFAEDGSTPVLADATNGSPYRVSDIYVPITGLVNTTVAAYRQTALQTDQAVSNYLTVKNPEVDPTDPSVIPRYWPLYSPFFSTILSDMMSGVLVPSYLQDKYTDQDVLNTCKPYETWLAMDPANSENAVDPNNAVVLPHPYGSVMSVSIYVYQFLQRVNRLYFSSTLNLTSYVSIQSITS